MASKTTATLLLNLDANTAQLNRTLNNQTKQLKDFGNKAKKIGSSLSKIFAVGAIVAAGKKIFEFGKELSTLAGEAEGVKAAFANLNAPGLLDEMRSAVKGTVDDVTLMKNAVKANEFGIPIEKMGTMMEFAALQAQKMGESTDYMVESITTGLARGSVQILDNLGLSAKQLQSEAKKTGDITSAAFSLMNKKLNESGGLLETTAVKQARWSTMIQNTKVKAGDLINKGLNKITPVILNIADAFKNFYKKAKSYIVDFINGWIELYNRSIAFRVIIEYIKFSFKTTFETIKLIIKNFINSIKNVGKILGYVFNPKNWGKGFSEGLKDLVKGSFDSTVEDVKEFGKATKENFLKGIENIKNGKAKLITEKEAEDEGKNAAVNFNKGFSSKVAPEIPEFKLDINDTVGFDYINESIAEISGNINTLSKETVKIFPFDSINYWNERLNSYNETLKNLVIGSEEYVKVQEKINEIQKRINEGQNTNNSGMETFIAQLNDINFQTSLWGDVVNGLTDTFGNLFNQTKTGFKSLVTGALEAIQKIINGLLAQAIAGMIAGEANKGLIGLATAAAGIGILTALWKNKVPEFETGGIVPGTSFSGDRVPVRVNSGELILNRAQQDTLAGHLTNNRYPNKLNIELYGKLSGSDIYLSQKNYTERVNGTR